MNAPLTDADLMEYIERTPELSAALQWGCVETQEARAIIARAFHAHEQRILAQRGTEPVAYLYTLEYGSTVANKKVSVDRLRYPFGVCGADYLVKNDDGISYVRETPLYAAPQPAVIGTVAPQPTLQEGPESNNLETLPAEVHEAINTYAAYYAEHHKLGMGVRNDMQYIASVALRFAAPQPAVPEGYALVPVEPTPEMIDAYLANNAKFHSAKSDWAAMLSAAPKPDKPAEGVQEGAYVPDKSSGWKPIPGMPRPAKPTESGGGG